MMRRVPSYTQCGDTDAVETKADPHIKGPASGLHGSRAGKDLVHGSRDHASVIRAAQHGVRFATARLPIGKDADLVAIQSALHQLTDLIKHFLLESHHVLLALMTV